MQYNLLGGTGLKVSNISLGAMNFGSRVSQESAFSILDKAHDFMHTSLMGVSTPEQLVKMCKIDEISLTEDEFKRLTEISNKNYIW